ncbi:hypothetical protein FC85_GL000946 [Lentilactobacillus diolivorans DSM 14421]|uniref:Uncharacterized protein n=1 Tax=Lentilactobacillus diolivorans DSM 14421 TaxID=1423739 RepID=A0A0R1SAL2_9LACO|nr:hypothetical protein FC85_GL000946 [Lentilactobacillus diolivorans DSM 14421]
MDEYVKQRTSMDVNTLYNHINLISSKRSMIHHKRFGQPLKCRAFFVVIKIGTD